MSVRCAGPAMGEEEAGGASVELEEFVTTSSGESQGETFSWGARDDTSGGDEDEEYADEDGDDGGRGGDECVAGDADDAPWAAEATRLRFGIRRPRAAQLMRRHIDSGVPFSVVAQNSTRGCYTPKRT